MSDQPWSQVQLTWQGSRPAVDLAGLAVGQLASVVALGRPRAGMAVGLVASRPRLSLPVEALFG